MSIDKALQQLFKLGIEVKKVWTNSSPTSSFAAQTLALDLNDKDFVLIECRSSTGNDYKSLHVCAVGESIYLTSFTEIGTANTAAYGRARSCSAKPSGLVFGGGSNKKITGTALASGGDAFMIPASVWTVKLLWGGV